jgi:hypothetical protein
MSMTILASGANIVTGAASAVTPLPPASNGTVPYKVRVSATVAARVRLGVNSAVALATDLLVQPNDALVLTVPRGVTHIAAIQDVAAGMVSVSPLEDC